MSGGPRTCIQHTLYSGVYTFGFGDIFSYTLLCILLETNFKTKSGAGLNPDVDEILNSTVNFKKKIFLIVANFAYYLPIFKAIFEENHILVYSLKIGVGYGAELPMLSKILILLKFLIY